VFWSEKKMFPFVSLRSENNFVEAKRKMGSEKKRKNRTYFLKWTSETHAKRIQFHFISHHFAHKRKKCKRNGQNIRLNTEPVFVNLLRSPGIDSQPGGIDSLESIPVLLKCLQIRALYFSSSDKQIYECTLVVSTDYLFTFDVLLEFILIWWNHSLQLTAVVIPKKLIWPLFSNYSSPRKDFLFKERWKEICWKT